MAPDIPRAVALLRSGELVAFPTETVYGLGADARNAQAVAKIFAVKGRPADHPLIVHLPLNTKLELWAREVPAAAYALADIFWPGPLTLILKRDPAVPGIVTGGQETVGLRVPDHPVARALLAAFYSGIAAPSANRFGRISPTTVQHVRAELGDRVPLILDGGPCQVGIESTILDLTRGVPIILRPGAIAANDIADILHVQPQVGAAGDESAPRVSGSLPRHYAPRTPMLLVDLPDLQAEVKARIAQGLRLAVLSRTAIPIRNNLVYWQRSVPEANTYAHDLYAHLRELDSKDVDLIVVEAPPRSGEWDAVNDRLTRAAHGYTDDEEP